MTEALRAAHDLTTLARQAAAGSAPRVSAMAHSLVGSEILRIAGEIRALVSAGRTVCDLTVGDFSPQHFPIPENAMKLGVAPQLHRDHPFRSDERP